MLPYYGSMLSVAGSTYFVFSNLFEKAMLVILKEDHLETLKISTIIVVTVCCVGPLSLAVAIMSALHEFPCRVLIYHRLWEHKIVVNFKQRNYTHKRTRVKLMGIAGIAAFYLGYGWFGLEATFSLVPVASALRHYSQAHKSLDADKPKSSLNSVRALSAFCFKKLSESTSDMLLVSEADVKHDIIALVKRSREQGKRLAKAPKPKSPLSFEQWRIVEEQRWVTRLATWTGRLSHTKESLGARLKAEDRDTYARSFFEVYDDELWHRHGSFARENNATEATRRWHFRSEKLCRIAVIVIELLGGARVWMIFRNYNGA